MRTLLLTLVGLLSCGCGPTNRYGGQCPEYLNSSECRDVLVARAKADAESSARIYQADAEYQRGLNEGFKKGLAYPGGEK